MGQLTTARVKSPHPTPKHPIVRGVCHFPSGRDGSRWKLTRRSYRTVIGSAMTSWVGDPTYMKGVSLYP